MLSFRRFSLSAWTIADQGTFSLANFALNVLLARWLVEEAYGAFTIAFTVFLLAGTVYAALLVEPMLVFGAGRFRQSLETYFGRLLQVHLLVSVTLGIILLVVAAALIASERSIVGRPLLVLGLVTPILLLQWLARRSVYVLTRPGIAAVGSIAYLVAVGGGAWFLERRGLLDAVAAIGLMAGASLLASLVTVFGLRRALHRGRPGDAAGMDPEPSLTLGTVVKAHRGYGRWSTGTALMTWLHGDIFYLILPLWTGLSGVAALRAMANLYLPMVHASVALGLLAVPVFVRWRERSDFRRKVTRTGAMLVAPGIAYAFLIIAGAEGILDFVYAGQYREYAYLAWLLAAVPAAEAAAGIFGGALRAIERPDVVFFGYLGGTLFTLTVGLALTAVYGLSGASIGWTASLLCTSLLLFLGMLRHGGGEAS